MFRDQTDAVVQKVTSQATKRKRIKATTPKDSSSPPVSATSASPPKAAPVSVEGEITSDMTSILDTINFSIDVCLPESLEGVSWTSNWQEWELSNVFGEPGIINDAESPSLLIGNDEETDKAPLIECKQNEADLQLELMDNLLCSTDLAPAHGLNDHSHPACAAFQFSPDQDYLRYLCNGSITGFQTIMPIVDLISDDRLASPYLYSAALAVSALSVSSLSLRGSSQHDLELVSFRSIPGPIARKHALQHYTAALASLSRMFPNASPESFQDTPMDQLLGWLMTRLLLSNIDLRLGCLGAWRAHLRAVGRVISVWKSRITQTPEGRSLVHAFARMALLVELENEDFAVTKQATMNPCVVAELTILIEQSASPRDRLLVLIREVSKVETKFRLKPEKRQKWIAKMGKIEAKLFEWQRTLPTSELPVDTGIAGLISHNTGMEDKPGFSLSPLTFPNSMDPYTAAVNYAHFLCARMRSRTTYGETSELIPSDDAETAILYICRIAAGLDPSNCQQVDAYGHGMMPAIVGAYRWSTDERVRGWIVGWLQGYGGVGSREGLWDVDQTRRLIIHMHNHYKDVAYKEWHLITARILPDDRNKIEFNNNEQIMWNMVARRGMGETEAIETELDDVYDGNRPFKVVLYTRSRSGPATHYITVT